MPAATMVCTSTRPTMPSARSLVARTRPTGRAIELTARTTGTCSGQPVSADKAHAAIVTLTASSAPHPAHCSRARSRAVARRHVRNATAAVIAASTTPASRYGAAGSSSAPLTARPTAPDAT